MLFRSVFRKAGAEQTYGVHVQNKIIRGCIYSAVIKSAVSGLSRRGDFQRDDFVLRFRFRGKGNVAGTGLGLQVFNRNDGLPDNQFNYKSALAASDGTIWMGTINGLVSFNPQIVHPNTFVPPVYITGMYVQGRETPFTADGVQLPYRSNVSFDFVALSYTSPDRKSTRLNSSHSV